MNAPGKARAFMGKSLPITRVCLGFSFMDASGTWADVAIIKLSVKQGADHSYAKKILLLWLSAQYQMGKIQMQPSKRGGLFLVCFRSILLSMVLFKCVHALTWSPLNGPSRYDSELPPAMTGIKLVRDQLFAMADSGLFVAVDDGASWLRSNSGLPKSIVLDIQAGDSLYFARTNSGIYTSSDGTHWSDMGVSIPKFHDMATAGRGLYVAGDSTVYFVRIQNGSWQADSIGNRPGLRSILFLKSWLIVNSTLTASPNLAWRTNDDGQTWQVVNSPLEGRQFEILSEGTTLYAGVTDSSWRSELKLYFYSSSDFGQSWDKIGNGSDGPTVRTFPKDYFLGWKVLDSAIIVHNHLFAVLPDAHSEFYITADGGNKWFSARSDYGLIAGNRKKLFTVQPTEKKLLTSVDFGESWNQQSNNKSILDPVLTLAAIDTEICASTPYYYGRIKCSRDGGWSWLDYNLNDFEWASVVSDGQGQLYRASLYRNPEIVGFSGVSAAIGRIDAPIIGVARSDSEVWAAYSWPTSEVSVVHQRIGKPYSNPSEYYQRVGLPRSPGHSLLLYQNRILLGLDAGVYRMDIGDTVWKPANSASPSTVVSLATDGKRLFGIMDGKLHTSPDAGTTWDVVDPQPSAVVTCVAVKMDTVYVGTNAGIWVAKGEVFPIPSQIIGSGNSFKHKPVLPRLVWTQRGPIGLLRTKDEGIFGVDGKVRKFSAPTVKASQKSAAPLP